MDIYLQNSNIRAELRRRAYIYEIENETFHQAELTELSKMETHLTSVPMKPRPEHQQLSSSETMMPSRRSDLLHSSPLNKTKTKAIAITLRNDSEQSSNQKPNLKQNHSKSTYQEQYCYEKFKAIQILSVEITSSSKINKTLSKQVEAIETPITDCSCNDDFSISCCCNDSTATEKACVCCCNNHNSNDIDIKNIVQTTVSQAQRKIEMNSKLNENNDCISTKVNDSELESKAQDRNRNMVDNKSKFKHTNNKPPTLKTMNNFKFRLFSNDIIDPNLKGME